MADVQTNVVQEFHQSTWNYDILYADKTSENEQLLVRQFFLKTKIWTWRAVYHPWWWRQYAPLKRRSTIILHGSISQKTTLISNYYNNYNNYYNLYWILIFQVKNLCHPEKNKYIHVRNVQKNKTWMEVKTKAFPHRRATIFTPCDTHSESSQLST
jgi:hypothetical protein